MNPLRKSMPATTGTVLCAVGWWPTDPDVAGIFIREHILAIAQHRPVVVVYMEVLKSDRLFPTIAINRVVEHGLVVYRVHVSTPIRRFGLAEFMVRRAYHRTLELIQLTTSIRLIHIHVRTEVTEQVLTLADELAVPVVVTEHNSFYHLGIRSLPPGEQETIRRSIRKWFMYPGIAEVMPVSKDLARVLNEDFGVPQHKITVVPNIAADVFRFTAPPPPSPFRIVLAAMWRPPKDHDVFIRALRSIPAEIKRTWRIDWIGRGPDIEHIMERCTNELPDMDIRFPGLLDKPALAQLMQHAHVFVLPTTADNLPCVVLESLCCGTPVLSMAVNGVPELVDHTNGVLVPPADPKALAQAILQFHESKDRWPRHMIAMEAQAKYSAQAVGARMIAVQNAAMLGTNAFPTELV